MTKLIYPGRIFDLVFLLVVFLTNHPVLNSYNLISEIYQETHIFETSVKESITKIAYLEHELLAEKNERTKMEIEFNTYKLKQANELKVSK
jgi:hypothetical protein